MNSITYVENPVLANDSLNALFAAAEPDHKDRDFEPILARSLTYIAAFDGGRLVGFVNVAWDGGLHGILLDPTVHPSLRRRGIGLELVHRAAAIAGARGLEWLHVDYVPELASFYQKAGFRPTLAGVLRLADPARAKSALAAPAG